LPLTDTNPVDGARGQQALNSVDYNPLLRAALMRMDRWVSAAEAPPPSRYPRLADGTAVPPEQTKGIFTAIPGVGFPAHPPQVIRLDFGPDAGRGMATTLPPVEGKPYPHFVPAVDRDGNEVTGIRLPDLTVPLATYTGWNLRARGFGHGAMHTFVGSTLPFAETAAERGITGDPRPSIRERYPDRQAYVAAIKAAIRILETGAALGIFPEGTRNKDGTVRPQMGVALLAAMSGATVLPAYVAGTAHADRLAKITVAFGEPMRPELGRKATRDELAKWTDELMSRIYALRENIGAN